MNFWLTSSISLLIILQSITKSRLYMINKITNKKELWEMLGSFLIQYQLKSQYNNNKYYINDYEN